MPAEYQRAIGLNPTLEDPDLLAQLTAPLREVAPVGAHILEWR